MANVHQSSRNKLGLHVTQHDMGSASRPCRVASKAEILVLACDPEMFCGPVAMNNTYSFIQKFEQRLSQLQANSACCVDMRCLFRN